MAQRFGGNALALFRRPVVMRAGGGGGGPPKPPKPPADLVRLYQSFRPPYQYNNGISEAYFVKLVFWTDAGKWCGQWVAMYQTDMTGGGKFWTERYFWGFRSGSFIEIKQHDVRGPRKRLLRG